MSVLVLRALGIGDLATAVPVLRGIRAARPTEEIVLAAPAWLAPLARLTGAVDRVLPVDEVYADQSVLYHQPTGRKLTYGELVDEAAQLPVPQNPKLKTRDQFKLIGKNVPRRDTPDKVTGIARIGSDESGKGDYFGPLVVAAVYVDEQTEAQLLALGVRDSKLLPDNIILAQAEEIDALDLGE